MIAFKRLAEVMMEKYGIYVPLSEVGYDNFVHRAHKQF